MKTVCETCRTPDVTTACELCANPLCDDCVLTPPTGSFSLLEKIPEKLSHVRYCRFCYDAEVEPELVRYAEVLARAEEVFIFFKTQRKEIPLIKKAKETLRVPECTDRDETILRLAFMAAEKGYNAVIETEALAQKVRNHAHQKMRWHGTGIPAQVDEAKLDRQHRRDQVYR